ncbi:hypothetical protein AO703_10275 [[Enterobacter] lignolyticus]|uniref:Uncharacterized protein n=1 Tax=[Enterobacter] lignolyticus TaxID=1334193 RepID=A0A806X4K8_9ENTR|nr:hypothetical protein AO703_10275 [[Enterobacter] lignolyticus]
MLKVIHHVFLYFGMQKPITLIAKVFSEINMTARIQNKSPHAKQQQQMPPVQRSWLLMVYISFNLFRT